jgi:mono/diheme cytochrome c family protein
MSLSLKSPTLRDALGRPATACLAVAVVAASVLGTSCKAEEGEGAQANAHPAADQLRFPHHFRPCSDETLSAYLEGVTKEKKPVDFSEDRWCAPRTFAGGTTADLATLNDGHDAYMLYCYACHGENGDGKGPSSYGLRPPPRNFTQGIFKFARMRSSDDLPPDEDLLRIVHNGLNGTPMLAWDIPETELAKILQFIKTFAPQKWEKKKKGGEPVKVIDAFQPPADPWAGKEADGVRRGKELYHFKAECVTCHPAYGGRKELYELSVAANKREPDLFKPITGFRDDFYGSIAKDSSEYGVRILPPDFTFSNVRSVRTGHDGGDPGTPGQATEDLFRVISYGVYPIMPAWSGALEDKDIWAIAHYVKSLMDLRDTREGAALREQLTVQAAFQVPAPAPEPTATPEAEAADAGAADGGGADAGAVPAKKDDKKAPAPGH